MAKAEKVSRGLYRVCWVTHTQSPYPGEAICGGQIMAERFGPTEDVDGILSGSWECFCEVCGDCDMNGYDTLRECIEASPEYWMEVKA